MARLLAWVGGLVAAIVLLQAIGHGDLAGPSLTEPGSWGDWLAARDASTAAVAVLRLVTLWVAWYLVAATVVVAAAELTRFGRLVTVADVVALPAVQRVVQGALGVGLSASTLAALGAGGGAPAAVPTTADLQMAAAVSPEPGTATMSTHVDEPAPGPAGQATMTRVEEARPAAGATWTVGPGDHCWSIAERHLAAAWGVEPAEDDVAPYWRSLLAANAAALPDPDLLHVGTVLVLPPVPPAP